MKKKSFLRIGAIVLCLALLSGGAYGAMGTGAWFSDVAASEDNLLTAGTLDLTVNGENDDVVKFTVDNFIPGNQPVFTYILKNKGSIDGFIDLHDIEIIDLENLQTYPEKAAGDIDKNVGELSSMVGISIYNDVNKDGYWSVGDVSIYDGLLKNFGPDYDANIKIPAGTIMNLQVVINWWPTANDNLAQSDSTEIEMEIELGQKAIEQ